MFRAVVQLLLAAVFGSVTGPLQRNIGLGKHQGPQHLALLAGELIFELRGIEDRLALLGWKLTQIPDRFAHHSLPGYGHLAHLLHHAANLLALLGGQPLQGLEAL